MVNALAELNYEAHPRADAPSVYIREKKICSLGFVSTRLFIPRPALNIVWIFHHFA